MPVFEVLQLLGTTTCARAAVLATEGFQPDMNFALIGMQVLITVWVFVLGTCFGSFLNVVIYRLPAGMSLGHPKSRCPSCETQLAARDNVPVLGWLWLRGRCRYCRSPISARYPIVEATCGFILLSLMFSELLTGGLNNPFRHPDHFHGVNSGFWLVWFTNWDLLGLFAYHSFMLICCLAIALIGFDGHLRQRRLVLFAVGCGLLSGAIWPDLRPVGFLIDRYTLLQNWIQLTGNSVLSLAGPHFIGLADGLTGLAAGLLAGGLLGLLAAEARSSRVEQNLPVQDAIAGQLMLVGSFLGWQAVGMLWLLATVVLGMTRLISAATGRRQLIRWMPVMLFLTTWTMLIFWRWLDQSFWMIGIFGWKWTSAAWPLDWSITFLTLSILTVLLHHFVPIPPASGAEARGSAAEVAPVADADAR